MRNPGSIATREQSHLLAVRADTPTAAHEIPVSRRAAVRLGAAGLAAGLGTRLSAPSAVATQDDPATFVLVHSAWAGGWIWRDIIALLRAAGHQVYASTATGMGERVHLANPAIDLDTHISDVVNLLEFEDLHEVSLVGWSYGGLIISGVAEQAPERLAQLVYLDATVPADGQTGYEAELYSEEAIAADIASGLAVGMPGFFTFAPALGWLEANTTDPAVLAWVLAHLTPQSLATYTQPIVLGNPDAAAVPRVFLFCTEGKGEADVDHTVRTRERVQSDPGWTVVELNDTHLVPLNDPRAVTEVLLSLV